MTQTFELRGGWKATIIEAVGGADLLVENPGPNGEQKFFVVSTLNNPYGAPMIEQEPTRGVPVRSAGVDLDGNIVGIIVLDEGGQVVERTSLSNLAYVKDQAISINVGGRLRIAAEPMGFLRLLILPDKNRMTGYVGVFGPEPCAGGDVKVLELEDLAALALRF